MAIAPPLEQISLKPPQSPPNPLPTSPPPLIPRAPILRGSNTTRIASKDSTLKLWDLWTGNEVATFSGDCGFNSCTLTPDGVTVVAGDESGRVHFLRLEGL